MHVTSVERRTCTEEVFKDIQNLSVVLLQNLHVAFVVGDFRNGLTSADT